MWALIRAFFLKGGTLEEGIKLFAKTNKGITKSDGQKLINIFQDVKKNTATVTDLQKFKDKKGIKSIPVDKQFTKKPNVEEVYFDNPNDPRLFKPSIKERAENLKGMSKNLEKLEAERRAIYGNRPTKQENLDFAKKRILEIDDELEKLSYGEGKYAKMNRREREAEMLRLQDESSDFQKIPGIAEGKFNDEFRSFKLNIAKNNPEFNQDLAKKIINKEMFKDVTTEQRKQVLDALEFVLRNPEGMASGGIARVGMFGGKLVTEGIKSALKRTKKGYDNPGADFQVLMDDASYLMSPVNMQKIKKLELYRKQLVRDILRKEGGGKFTHGPKPEATGADLKLLDEYIAKLKNKISKEGYYGEGAAAEKALIEERPDLPFSKFVKDKSKHAEGGLARVGMAGGGILKEFIEKLFIKASNDIRQGKGLFKGLNQEQMITQHDNLTKMLKKWEMSGKKGLPEGAEQFIGMNDLQVTKAIKDATSEVEINKVLNQAYDEVAGGSGFSDDYKMAADQLSDSIAEQLGKNFDDLSQTQQTQIQNIALKRTTQDLKKRLSQQTAEGIQDGTIDISDPKVAEEFTTFIKKSDPEGYKDLEQKIQLSDFDVTGRKKNASGGIAGQLHMNEGGRVPMIFGGSAGLKGLIASIKAGLNKSRSAKDKIKTLFPKYSADEKELLKLGEKYLPKDSATLAAKEIEAKAEGIQVLIDRLKHDKKLLER